MNFNSFVYVCFSDFEPAQSSVKFSDIGGCDDTVEQVCKLLVHMRHPEVFRTLGVTPPRGFLLHGPPGCGKTLLAHAIAGVCLYCISKCAQKLNFMYSQLKQISFLLCSECFSHSFRRHHGKQFNSDDPVLQSL